MDYTLYVCINYNVYFALLVTFKIKYILPILVVNTENKVFELK